jgi:hypothetical protein
MGASEIIRYSRPTGVVLILAFIVFAIGASLPLMGEKGNASLYSLPEREYLLAVANNAMVWRWANVILGAAAVLLLAGLSLLTTMLEGAKEQTFSRLGLVGFVVAAVMWLIFSAFRATVTVSAAQEMSATGTVPGYYGPLAQWGGALFLVYASVGFLALAIYGVSLIQVRLVPAWAGWATIIFSLAMLVLLLIKGDNLPAFHYLPPLLIGILLLFLG